MSSPSPRTGATDTSSSATVDFIASAARPFESAVDLEPLVRRLGRAQMVMLGEASHGTHEFYSVRAMITEQLVREHGFRAVAVEGDWPSSQPLNKFMRGGVKGTAQDALKAFEHYPSWMWNNKEIAELADRLRKYNDSVTPDQRVGFYGMDIYSMFPSMSKVLERLESLDPALAERARKRFSCFDPFECDAESYASSLITNPRGCRDQVVKILNDIFAAQMAAKKEAEQEGVTHPQSSSSSSSSSTASAMDADTEPVEGHSADTEGHSASSSTSAAHTSSFASASSSSTEPRDDEADDSKLWKFFDAEQNARIVKNAESYYRTMIMGSEDSWNVRDRHMMETLEILQQRYGKVVVWAHNTHVGDYRYTDMAKRGEINIGGLARERLGARADQVQLVGFSTFDGEVVASSFYGGPAYLMRVPQARAGSYDSLMHEAAKTIGAPQFFMSWEHEGAPEIRSGPLTKWRTQRAIGVVYNPAVERYGNYVPTSLAQRYDHVVYIDNTQAVESILPLNGKVGF